MAKRPGSSWPGHEPLTRGDIPAMSHARRLNHPAPLAFVLFVIGWQAPVRPAWPPPRITSMVRRGKTPSRHVSRIRLAGFLQHQRPDAERRGRCSSSAAASSTRSCVSARGTADRWAEIGAYGRRAARHSPELGHRRPLRPHPGSGLPAHPQPGVQRAARDWWSTTRSRGMPAWSSKTALPTTSRVCIGRSAAASRSGVTGRPTDDGFDASAGIAVSGAAGTSRSGTARCFRLRGGSLSGRGSHAGPHLRPPLLHLQQFTPPGRCSAPKSGHAELHLRRVRLSRVCGDDGHHAGRHAEFTIRNCTFRNQPDSGSHDEGGIDFENGGDGCLIDNCTFENNAGAAIEVLGLQSPQPKNVEIRGSRFIKNNWARKLGPVGDLHLGKEPARIPQVCCSNGIIRNNGYVLLPGVSSSSTRHRPPRNGR